MNSADRGTIARLENAERKRTHNRAFCFLCRKTTPLLTFRQAAQICEMTVEEVLRCATDGAVHRLHNSHGEVLICRNSLQKIAAEKQITLPLSLELLQELEAA